MDTKLKSNKKVQGRLVAIVIGIVLSIIAAIVSVTSYQYVNSRTAFDYTKTDRFQETIYKSGYYWYWKAMNASSNEETLPSDLYYPQSRLQQQYDDGIIEENTDFYNMCDAIVMRWGEEFEQIVGESNFAVRYKGEPVKGLGNSSLFNSSEKQQQSYLYYVELEYPTANYNHSYGVDLTQQICQEIGDYTLEGIASEIPKDIEMVVAIPKDIDMGEMYDYQYERYWHKQEIVMASAQPFWLMIFIGITVVVAFIMRRNKEWCFDDGLAKKMPLEYVLFVLLLGIPLLLSSIGEAASLSVPFTNEYPSLFNFVSENMPAWLVAGALVGVAYIVVYGIVFSSVLVLWQVVIMGPSSFVRQRIWLVSIARWLLHRIKRLWMWCKRVWLRFYKWVTDIDLREKGNKTLLKILGINLAFMVIFAGGWIMGIPGSIIYTIVLFVFLSRYTKKLKRDYTVLLDATQQISNGNFDVNINEDIGVFNPLKEELQKVSDGFEKAVEAETKSQMMKTELITNVSHDLKTPLTAIITYVDLLKNENITPEERRSYVDTLDRRSQRLKYLIEDLFEVSKASSGNISLDINKVDIVSLIKQVEADYAENLQEANIELRNTLPDKKVELLLDGEKTSRVFENLLQNIVKYGMPHSRAYIELRETEENVTIEIKNISREEMNFTGENITERFVRGDLSRGTEGSGLGLAIAKSFTELQKGSFSIQVDGDLFKVLLGFSKILPE